MYRCNCGKDFNSPEERTVHAVSCPQMAQQDDKLREKIARFLYEGTSEYSWATLPLERPKGKASYLCTCKRPFYDRADQILAFYKEALPELAKEAGYLSLPVYESIVDKCYCCLGKPDGAMLTIGNQMAHATCIIGELNKLLDPDYDGAGNPEKIVGFLAGYVQLADDQTLPTLYPDRKSLGGSLLDNIAYHEAQQDMLIPKDGTIWRKVLLPKSGQVEVKDGS